MNAREIAIGTAAVVAASVLTYARLVRPRANRWGATDEEVARPMAGDAIVRRADFLATRAITIAAPPERVWPWLVQIGSGRAGWYSYDRLDNGGMASAEEVLPQFQRMVVDDLVPMIPGTEVGVWVRELDEGRRMLWWDRKGEYSWEWVLEAVEGDRTRLVTRLRATYPPLLSRRRAYALVATTGDIVMIRRCLLGIRRRAERVATATVVSPAGQTVASRLSATVASPAGATSAVEGAA